MSQVDIQTDTEGRIIGLSGNFTKWTNSNGEEDHFAPDAVTITVPENMEAHVSASMTVDDWGYIDITPLSGGGSTIRAINLTTEVASPGPRGGHVRWSGQTNEAIVLQPGQYSIIIRQDNAPYGEAYASEAGTNVSFCQASVTIEYVAILAPKKNLLSRSRAIALLDAYTKYNYEQENCPYAEDVWEKVGGELLQLHTTKPEYYYNTCALRVSLALSELGVDYSNAIGAAQYNNVNVLLNGYAILSANAMTAFMRDLLGEPTYTSYDEYVENAQPDDIIFHGGMLPDSEDDHVGICQGVDNDSSNGITTMIWVLNSMSSQEPESSKF